MSNLRLEDGSKVAFEVAGKRLAEQEPARSVKAKRASQGSRSVFQAVAKVQAGVAKPKVESLVKVTKPPVIDLDGFLPKGSP